MRVEHRSGYLHRPTVPAPDDTKAKRGVVAGRALALDESPSSTSFESQSDEVERGASAVRYIRNIDKMPEQRGGAKCINRA